jgi:hypothetical protein
MTVYCLKRTSQLRSNDPSSTSSRSFGLMRCRRIAGYPTGAMMPAGKSLPAWRADGRCPARMYIAGIVPVSAGWFRPRTGKGRHRTGRASCTHRGDPCGRLLLARRKAARADGVEYVLGKSYHIRLGGGFCRNELTLELPTKSMPSGFRAAAILHHWRPVGR